MARDYGRVSTRFWNSKDVRPLSDRGKLLANYLLTGPHSNSIGAYLLPNAYVSDDLGWPAETVSKVFSELFKNGFCERFADGRHIVVCKFLGWNPIENPNVGKGALKQLGQLPDDAVLHHVLEGLQQYAKHFPDGFETVLERLRNMEPNLSEPIPNSLPAGAGRAGEKSSDPEFEEFWKAFKPPPNAKKPDALRAWNSVAKTRPQQTELLRAVAAYNTWLAEESRKQKRDYPKQHAATWLRGEVWNGFLAQAPTANIADMREQREGLKRMGYPTHRLDRAIEEAEARAA